MQWIISHWEMLTIVILIIDKIVALSPSKLDDLLWSSIKGIIYKFKPKK